MIHRLCTVLFGDQLRHCTVTYVYMSMCKVTTCGAVDRLTDTSKYTGSHKERFDESGKGRGLEGRDSVAKGQGMSAGSVASQTSYVSGYKNEGTYGKK